MAPITEPESISNGDAARNHHAVQNGDMRHLPSSNGDIPTAPSIDTPVSTNTHREPLSDLSAVQSEAVSSTLQAASAEADNSASINVPVENAVSAPSRSQEEQAAVTLTSGASPSEQEQSATEPNTGTDEKRPKAAASEPTNERNTSASEKPPMSVLPAMGADALLGLDDLLASVDVYELGNYTFGRKERDSRSFALRARSRVEEQTHLAARHRERGLRRSVAAVVLVHEHRFAHVLLLQRSDGTGDYALPGGRLRPGESDEDGLMRKLRAKLTPDGIEPDQLDISERRTFHFCRAPRRTAASY